MALEICFKNHIYQCENFLYCQEIGGGIGARVTGVVARVLMDVWADKMASCLELNGILMYIMVKYVDDINTALQVIPKGHKWTQDDKERWILRWSQEQMEKDERESKSDSLRTMELVREVGNSLVPGLKLTLDIPEFHQTGKVPMLDIQVWVDQEMDSAVIRHSFYQKPSTSPLVFHSGGAHGWRSKLVTLAEELRRRFLHMDAAHLQEERALVIGDFLTKMADSG